MLSDFKFHHIGVATNSIENTARYYIEAGFNKSETIYDPVQNVNICFLAKNGMPTVELLEPVDEKSPVYMIVKNSGVTPYHCCYKVKDIETAVSELRKKKFTVLSKPVDAIALENHRICFLFNKEVGLIEIVELENE